MISNFFKSKLAKLIEAYNPKLVLCTQPSDGIEYVEVKNYQRVEFSPDKKHNIPIYEATTVTSWVVVDDCNRILVYGDFAIKLHVYSGDIINVNGWELI